MSANHLLTTNDIVRLKKPYCPDKWVLLKPGEWKGFEFGIVADILQKQFTVNSKVFNNAHPRNVSLHLYDATGQLMSYPQHLANGLFVPTYADFHISELIPYRIAAANGYKVVNDPPDWDNEVSVLQEFGVDS